MSFSLSEKSLIAIELFLQVKQILCFKGFYDTCNNFVIILPASLKYLFT